ncbi:adenosine deaminase [Limimaricola pyoseonensis]|uniref:Adenosine deaminase n=1 Tax=Limimaricola pyoseonensis TaxID=521013 RepID=A0A1G7GBY1_9RHOB|nr:adenosine deaminase [Limimaricola pyoseonensis]SDE85603.1 adenosine deaminase [Limimaricola pyoseonensis]
MSWRALPKVELHLHLEGAAPPAFIRGLSREKHIDISRIFDERGGYARGGFEWFLKAYDAACTVLQGPEDYRRLLRAVLEQSADEGVVYTELFLSPDFCGGGDLASWRDHLDAMADAAAEAERERGIVARGIVTCLRQLGPGAAKPIARCAAETAGGFVTGFGMAGAEMRHRPGDFGWAFDCAREAGLGLTAHAGEWGGPDMVRETVDLLGCTRIGHGINAVGDHALCDHLIEKGVTLEVCPVSNLVLGAVKDWRSHPIETLRDRGVRVTVSTDDPPWFGTSMSHEYDMLEKHFGWEEERLRIANTIAAEAAFCDEDTRQALIKRLEAA